MTFQLRILLIIVSFLTVVFVLRKIRKSQMKIGDAIWWILMPIMILILSIFPEIAIQAAVVLGVESPVNLVYLFIIFLLMIIIFDLSVKMSRLGYKLETLVEELAIREKMKDNERYDK